MSDVLEPSDRDERGLDRDERTGRFLPGNNGGPGRRVGSRNHLQTEFLAELHRTWQAEGREALQRCAREDPTAFVRVVASLLPREAQLDVSLDLSGARSALEAYRTMCAMIGADSVVAIRNLRRVAPNLAIEYEPEDE
jgi:hypothetical protein